MMIYREYGKNGEKISVTGFGGIIVSGESQHDSDAYVAEAIDRGVNYFDVAPTYGDAEEKLGKSLRGKRNGVFLACKTAKRTAIEAEASLKESFKRLETDHFDLYQLHGVSTEEDVKTITGPGGCLEFFVKAKQQGYIKHIGFSAHSEKAALMLLDSFPFESVLFPYNWVCLQKSGFGETLLREAKKRGVACLALKAMAYAPWGEGEEKKYPKCWYKPVYDMALAALAFRFTLSSGFVSALTPGYMEYFRVACDSVDNFSPPDESEMRILKEQMDGGSPIF